MMGDGQLTLPGDGCVHVWRVGLDERRQYEDSLAAALSAEEVARVGRFRTRRLAARYVTGRGVLRRMLGLYLRMAPGEIPLVTNKYGKPGLDGEAGSGLEFNLAHSGDVAMYAFAVGRAVGIDVEVMGAEEPAREEARRIMMDGEWKDWQGLSGAEQRTVFYRTWVRKEAMLKALGVGLAIEPDTFGADGENVIIGRTEVVVRDIEWPGQVMAAVAAIGTGMPEIVCYSAEAGP